MPVIAGSELPLASRTEPQRSAAAEAIVAEAMRDDTDLPLFVVLGAGLTELASAYLLEPAIADRLTAVWIGGPEYAELGAVPPRTPCRSSTTSTSTCWPAQVVFDSPIPLWQVPRNAYRECIASISELILRVAPRGQIGAHLYQTLIDIFELVAPHGLNMGEVYVLGDSPLVLLTALQTASRRTRRPARTELPRTADRGRTGAICPTGRDILCGSTPVSMSGRCSRTSTPSWSW